MAPDEDTSSILQLRNSWELSPFIPKCHSPNPNTTLIQSSGREDLLKTSTPQTHKEYETSTSLNGVHRMILRGDICLSSTTQAVEDHGALGSPCVYISKYLFDIELETQRQMIVNRLLDLFVDRNPSRLGE